MQIGVTFLTLYSWNSLHIFSPCKSGVEYVVAWWFMMYFTQIQSRQPQSWVKTAASTASSTSTSSEMALID